MKRIKLILVIAMLSMVTVGFMPMIQGVNGVANAVTTENCNGNCAHVAAIGTTHYDTVQAAIDAATNDQTVQMIANSKENVAFNSTKTITLDLNGKVLEGKGDNSVIKVAKTGSKLTITDSNPNAEHKFIIPETGARKAGLWKWDETNGTKVVKGGIITGGKAGNGGGVYANAGSSGALVLEGGSIVGCEATSNGGGVYAVCPFTMTGGAIIGCEKNGVMLMDNANFKMTGGTISNCNSSGEGGGILTSKNITIAMSGEAKITECEATNGGGLCIGSEKNPNAQFTMSGNASISKCSASNSTSEYYGGGGVWIRGTMTLKDNASISECEASNGGGVLARSGIFNMEGGSISQCKIVKNGSNAYKGGGVFVSESSTKFIMTGGVIEKCEASVSGSYNTAGGGVCVYNGGSFIFSGGTISQCNTNNNGGGVYVYKDGVVTVGGTAKVTGNTKGTGDSALANNLYLVAGNTVSVSTDTPLAQGAAIGVTLGATGGVGEVTGTNSNDYSGYFTADDAALYAYNDANVVKIGVPVAKIVETGKGYSSVQAAIDAATSGQTQTVKMLADTTENVKLSSSKTVTLDLNGHVLKGTGEDRVINNVSGALTIMDSNANNSIHYFTYHTDKVWGYMENPTSDQKSNAIALDAVNSSTTDGTVIKISGGAITGGNRSAGSGGAVYVQEKAKLTLSGINVVGNTARSGGAIYGEIKGADISEITCSGCIIAGNTAVKTSDGGLGGGIYTKGAVEITSSKIGYNHASVDGGALYAYGTSAKATSTQFMGNSSVRYGGAVYIPKDKTFTADKCTFSNNKATGSEGFAGAIFINDNGTVTITGCSFDNNTSKATAGVIYNKGTLDITNSNCKNNSAKNGGVIFNFAGKVTINGGTFESNTATAYGNADVGGGVLCSFISTVSNAEVTITGATIKNNQAVCGGGISNWSSDSYTSTITIKGCDITNNSAELSGGGIDNNGTLIISGTTKITGNKKVTGTTSTDNNVYLYTGKTITVGTSGLDTNAAIGVTTADTPSAGSAVNITGSNGTNDYSSFFSSDNTAYDIVENGTKTALVVASGIPVAKITKGDVTKKFLSVQNAIDFASEDDTIVMLADSTENVTVASDDKVTLDLNGHVVKAAASGSVIANNGTLTIKDSKHSDTTVKHYFTVGSNGVWEWNNDASATDNYVTGGVITGGNNSSEAETGYGNGVANKGTLTIDGVNIVGNSTGNWGGGLLSEGGSVTVKNSLIAHNYAKWCAAVGVKDSGTHSFENTEISNNKSKYEGGGFYIEAATATLTNCTITGNTSDTSHGGGLYLKNGAAVTMTGGSVTNNSAAKSNGAAYLTNETGKSACSLTLNGVSVTGNTAKNSAGGIAINNGHSLSVSGTTKISGNTYGTTPVTSNVYLASGKTITVGTGSGANVKYLENGAFIGVTTEDVPAAGTRIDITGSNSANYSSYFTSDNTNYKVINTGENTSQILRLRAHEHAWKYEVDSADTTGATLKATCTDTVGTCDSTANESLTIVIPAHETYGDGKSATATFKDSKTSIGGLSTLPAIKYQKKTGESTYEDLNAAPTDAGTYKASITIGTGTDAKTASVEYTIAKAAVTLSNISATEITYGQTLADSTVSGTAKFGDTDVSGTWSWKTAATTKPEISDSENTEYDVSFTPAATETNFKVTDGKVKIKVNKQDYTGDKTATAMIKAKAGSTVEVTLPNIPEGASYGTPTSANAKVSSSAVTSQKITLTVVTALVKVTDSEFKVTVPVTGANIYKDYNIEVTVTPVYKEVVTINATAENFTYGDTGKTGYTGLSVTGDKVAVEDLVKTYYKKGSTSALEGVPTAAGEYKLVISVAETNEDYEGSKEVEFEIAKKSITVSAENKTSYVGQNLVDLTYTNDALCDGDSFTGNLSTAADMNTVGSYAITQGTLTAGDNYSITFTPGTYTVSDKAIQTLTFEDVTDGNVSKSYGDSKFTETVTGADTTVTYSSSDKTVATVDSNGEVTILKAGSTTITATAAESAEYAEGTAQYTLTVNKKSISVTADNKSSYVGADLVALTYTADALCVEDSFTGALETNADKSKTGSYDITQGTLTAGDNYNISFTKGTYTVGEKRVDPTPVDPTPAIVVPVSGDKKEVKVEAQINGNNAIVKTVTSEEINEVGTGAAVVVDLSNVEIKGKNQEISEATITKDTLKNVEKSDATGLEIRLSTATAVIDKTTLKTLIGESTGNDIHLVVDVDSKAEQTLTKAQKETIGEMNEPKVLDAYFVSNGKRISDFNGGKVKLLVEYPTDKPVRVWFVANEGDKDKINSTFDEKMGIASFEADHFSHYVIETVEEIKDILIASGSAKGKTNTIKWAAVEGADFYEVYFARCGGEYKKIKSLAALKYVKKGLDPKKEYKYKVKAYKKTEDGKVCISTSPTIHIAGSKSKYSNATKLTVDKTELSLKAGETAKISAKVAKKSSKKALLWKRHVSGQIRYISSDKAVATVDSKGNVQAVGEGVAYVYAIATNGLSTKTEVVVESNLGAVWIGG